MKKTPFSLVLCICATTLVTLSAADDLQCYQCNPVTSECADNKADVIKCGDVATSRCARMVKLDSADKTKALRKCVIPDKDGNVHCQNGYVCSSCSESLCNADPAVTKSTTTTTLPPASKTAPGSASLVTSVWSTVLTLMVASIYF